MGLADLLFGRVCFTHAMRHCISALAVRWPSLHRISPWFDEAFLAFSVLVEARFLSNHSSLLSESFYGLRRCRYGPKLGPPGEGEREERRSPGMIDPDSGEPGLRSTTP